MKKIKLPYGESDFKTLRYQNYIYVDKTKYIRTLENYPMAIYVRPRRFGKSLFTSMISYYYDIKEEENFEKLYKGLYIYDNPTSNKNKYYILKFNFSGMNISSNKTEEEIEELFDKKVYSECQDFIDKYNFDIEITGNKVASMTLMELLRKFTNLRLENKIYVMIDGYDYLINGIFEGNKSLFSEESSHGGFVRAFYEVIKEYAEGTNSVVDRFFATGVVPISLDSFSSGFNIAINISADMQFNAMCGFEETEVKKLMKDIGLDNSVYEEIKKNYGGYRFSVESEEYTFNPAWITYYLQSYTQKEIPLKETVAQILKTSENKIESMVNVISPEKSYKKLVELTTKGKVNGNLVRQIELNSKRFDQDCFISLLFYQGYITIKDVGFDITFCVPNIYLIIMKKLKLNLED